MAGRKPSSIHLPGGTDGSLPLGGVVFDENGNIYGTASNGGDPTCQCGVVYKLTPSGTFSVLHAFVGGNDGQHPASSMGYCCGFLRDNGWWRLTWTRHHVRAVGWGRHELC